MKTTTNYMKMLALFCVLLISKAGLSQGCASNFSVIPGPNGNVSFYAFAAGYTSVTPNTFYWNFGNGATATGTNMIQPATTYTANGVYTITLMYVNAAGNCTSTATQTVNISNANGGCNLNANFNYYNNNMNGGLGAVNFNSTSTGVAPGATYTWIFGDGSPNGTTSAPSHTYSSGGSYSVKLIINNNSNPVCVDSVTYNVFVCSLQASFTSTLLSNGNVGFTSTAAGTGTFTNYYWNFGDGGTYANTNAAGANTSHNYLTNGTFTVTLFMAVSGCSSIATTTITVGNVVAPCGLNANFNYTQGSNGMVNFNNTTIGASGGVTYSWAFGDGNTSSSTSPTHVYSANGTYMATLTANNNYSYTCTDTQTAVIIVNSYCALSAGFSPVYGANGNVSFTNTTTGMNGGTTYTWSFGDGGSSTGVTATHNYANGTYTVTLFASNNNSITPCVSTATAVITVTNACVANATFSMSPTGTPQFWNAFPMFPANIVSATWNWGDGSSSNTLYTSHTYSAAGTYSICLSVVVACGDSATYCTSYAIYRSSQDNNVIYVNVVDPNAPTGINANESKELSYSIAPNPNNGSFNLNLGGLNSDQVSISVYNLVGKLVYQSEGSSSNGTFTKNIHLNNVSNGVYFLQVNADNKVLTKKVMVTGQ